MTENEILLATIDLINAIQFRDEEKAKNLVEFLNKNFTPNETIKNLDAFLPVYKFYDSDRNNPVLLYVIYNLNGLSNLDELKWNISINNIIIKSNDEILNFILNTLSTSQKLSVYHLNSLIRLAIKIDKYDLLSRIRQLLKEVE